MPRKQKKPTVNTVVRALLWCDRHAHPDDPVKPEWAYCAMKAGQPIEKLFGGTWVVFVLARLLGIRQKEAAVLLQGRRPVDAQLAVAIKERLADTDTVKAMHARIAKEEARRERQQIRKEERAAQKATEAIDAGEAIDAEEAGEADQPAPEAFTEADLRRARMEGEVDGYAFATRYGGLPVSLIQRITTGDTKRAEIDPFLPRRRRQWTGEQIGVALMLEHHYDFDASEAAQLAHIGQVDLPALRDLYGWIALDLGPSMNELAGKLRRRLMPRDWIVRIDRLISRWRTPLLAA